MKLELDPTSPTPLYHQIAETLRYRIGTGRLSPGSTLPSVRKAAAIWGVNMHTIRRAYGVLAGDGLVEINGPLGTRVAARIGGGGEEGRAKALSRFLARTIREARESFGLSPHELARSLRTLHEIEPAPSPVHVVECSESECLAHAREIEARWDVRAHGWCLSERGELPPGPVVATYFHYNEIRRRWPHRMEEIHFVAIHADRTIAQELQAAGRRHQRITVLVCEFHVSQAQNAAADLSVMLPADRFRIKTRVVRDAGSLLKDRKGRLHLLFTPRVWATLSPREKADPRAHEIAYVIKDEDLEALGARLGWRKKR